MQREVIFRDDQKILTTDLNNLSLFSRQSFDALVTDAVSNLRYYTGFTVSGTGTEITVAPGRYWAGGPVYIRSDPTVFNLLTGGNYMPAVTQRIVAVTTWGEPIDTDTQERGFVIDDQGNEEPQSVAMERLRYARLSLVAGAESPDPQRPSLDAGVIPVAWVRLSTSGIVSIEMAEEYRLPSVESLSQLINTINTWRTQIGQILDTIQTELIRIQAAIPEDLTTWLRDILSRLDDLEELARRPASAVKIFVEKFLSLLDSDVDYAGYSALVEDGLRFPTGAPVRGPIALNNPNDDKVKIVNNIMMPAWSEVRARLSIGNPDAALSISQYTSQVTERVQKTMSRTVTKYSRLFNVAPNKTVTSGWAEVFDENRTDPVALAEQARLFEQIKQINLQNRTTLIMQFRRDNGEVHDFEVNYVPKANNFNVRLVQKVEVEEPYWETVTRDATVTGSQIAQTFSNATNGWLVEIGVQFDQVAQVGDVHVFLVDVTGGKPNKRTVISRGVIPVANLVSNTEVKCQIEPAYVHGGRQYAVVLVSTGNHFVKVRQGNKYLSGAAYYLSDTGEWIAVQNSGDICMSLYFPVYNQSRIEILLEPLIRGGGIDDIRINAAQIQPKGTQLIYETQRAGTWYQISEGEYEALTGSPTQVSFRVVFVGTRDLMPAIDMSQTEVELGRAENEFTHVTELRELDAATSSVHVTYIVKGWDPATHDLDCEMILPGTPDTVEPADSQVVMPMSDDETTVTIKAVFTPSAITDYRIRTIGERDPGEQLFVVTQRREDVF